jgi:hypothetical protein
MLWYGRRAWCGSGLTLGHAAQLDASKNSPIWFVSDSIGVSESEMIACEVSGDFSMSMIA